MLDVFRSRWLVPTFFGFATIAAAQDATTVSARVNAALPPEVAHRVLAAVEEARTEHLPAQALANRALKFAARGVVPNDIATSIDAQLARMRSARDVLRDAWHDTRDRKPTDDEVEAGAEAMREGVDGRSVSALAKSAPSGRSLAVPLYVIGSLVNRGLPSDAALHRVLDRLQQKASDADLQADVDNAGDHRSTEGEHGAGAAKGHDKPDGGVHSDGPPADVPGNGGKKGRPPSSPPGKGHQKPPKPPKVGNPHS